MSAGGTLETVDVTIVGAGPGGSSAAVTLARQGCNVVLIDKAAFPRDKCCGDGLTTAALRRLQRLGVDPSEVPSWQESGSARVMTPSGRTFALDLPDDGTIHAASASRRDLDAAVAAAAARAGANLIQECELRSIAHAPEGSVQVGTSDGRVLLSHYVIAADGIWSPTRRALGLSQPGYLGEWHAGRQYFSGVGRRARSLWVWFDGDMIPGYAWSFPLAGGCANVGYATLRQERSARGDGQLRGQYVDLLERPHIAEVLGPDARPSGPWRAWPIPTGISRSTLCALGDRVLFVGDAARAADPMTGEGIAQALETGELAARAIASAGPSRPSKAAGGYRREVRSGIAVDHRLSELLSMVLARPDGADRSLGLVDSSRRSRDGFARWMFEDFPRAIVLTPRRWRRHRMSEPGAFSAPKPPG